VLLALVGPLVRAELLGQPVLVLRGLLGQPVLVLRGLLVLPERPEQPPEQVLLVPGPGTGA
jgi:hypothetical protein